MSAIWRYQALLTATIVIAVASARASRIDSLPKVVPAEEARTSYAGDGNLERTYDNYHLFVAHIDNEHQKEDLKRLEKQLPVLDFWNPVFVSRNVSILAPPKVSKQVESNLKKLSVAYTVASSNIQSWINHEKDENRQQNLFLIGGDPSRFSLTQYHTYDEISAYLDAVANRYPDVAQISNIGTTYEGRHIKGLKITSGGGNKPVIWIDSGIHAREWIAPASSLYIINKLVSGATTDPTVRALLSAYDFHVYPLLNADGYERTWNGDRMWRKNRVRFQGYSCQGVDPNRNFGYDFGGSGTSSDVCSEIYRGPHAFSELESQAVRDGVQALGSRVKMFLTVHSFSQLIMLPYGSGPRIQSRFYNDQLQVARAGQRSISASSGLHYKVGTVQQLLSASAGAAADWAHESAGIKYAYAIELRDRGQFGFLLPASQITPTGEEWYQAVAAMVDEMAHKETGQRVLKGTTQPGGSAAGGTHVVQGGGGNQIGQFPALPNWPPRWG